MLFFVAFALVDLPDLRARYGSQLHAWNQNLRSGGTDQITHLAYSTATAATLFAEPQVQRASRDMVLRCMRKCHVQK